MGSDAQSPEKVAREDAYRVEASPGDEGPKVDDDDLIKVDDIDFELAAIEA